MPAHLHSHSLYAVEQVRGIEHAVCAALDISGFDLMRRAASAALGSLRRHWPDVRHIGICCGPGNNGGDGFMLAVLAREAGLRVDIVALQAQAHGEAALARTEWEVVAGPTKLWDADKRLPAGQLLVDALYGIGLNRPPEDTVAELIGHINASTLPILALDVPSGLNADNGTCPGAAVRADLTVTFLVGKCGLHTGRAADHVGALEVVSLGMPEDVCHEFPAQAQLLAVGGLPRRDRYANKGNNGHVLLIGGEHGTAGAICLASGAALRVGAGLVSVATRSENVLALNAARPEVMAHGVDGPQALEALLGRASVLGIGPGLGQGAWGHALWLTALDAGKPLVLDADGLNLLAREPHAFRGPAVMTPHPGEAGRLLGVSTADIEKDRFAAVRAMAKKYAAVVVLKGVGSLIAEPSGRVAVCPWGNPGMASGGMGDLLTGVVAGLLAQGCNVWDAACLGVGLHARAGDVAAEQGERGMLASDLLNPIRALVNGLPGVSAYRD